jgi:hypothetical protein
VFLDIKSKLIPKPFNIAICFHLQFCFVLREIAIHPMRNEAANKPRGCYKKDRLTAKGGDNIWPSKVHRFEGTSKSVRAASFMTSHSP